MRISFISSVYLFSSVIVLAAALNVNPVKYAEKVQFNSSCSYRSSNGLLYDFSALRRPDKDYFIPADHKTQFWDFYLNLCTPLESDICEEGCGACQKWDSHSQGHACMGTAASLEFGETEDKQITATMSQGQEGRVVKYYFKCDATVDSELIWLEEKPALEYHLEWKTRWACAPQQPCENSETCYDCTIAGSCRWCLDSNICVDETSGCMDYLSNSTYCPDVKKCSKFSSCWTCTTDDDCSWCLDTQRCVADPVPCSNKIHKTTFCSDRKNVLIN